MKSEAWGLCRFLLLCSVTGLPFAALGLVAGHLEPALALATVVVMVVLGCGALWLVERFMWRNG